MIKWILLLLLIIAANTHAARKYSQAECILLKHQLSDYNRRLGTENYRYQDTKVNLSKFCVASVTPVKRRKVPLILPTHRNSPKAFIKYPEG